MADDLLLMRVDSSNTNYKTWYSKVDRFLFNKFGNESAEYRNFKKRSFHPQVMALGDNNLPVKYCCRDIEVTKNELIDYMTELSEEEVQNNKSQKVSNKLFIVHGHDGELKLSVARMLEKIGVEAIILSEQANKGRTIIEKFEDYSDVGAAIALFTKDDKCINGDNEKYRARQNVVFEAGYLMGKLGRDRVIIIAESDVEIPSDLSGMVYTNNKNFEFDVCKELNSMGYEVDLNKLL